MQLKGYKDISKKDNIDAASALLLIILIVGLYVGQVNYFKLAVAIVLLQMIWPVIFLPFSLIWFGFSFFLGWIMSRLILSLIFIIMVLPVGFYRRLSGVDTLNIRGFKKHAASVFKKRSHTFSPKDFEQPF